MRVKSSLKTITPQTHKYTKSVHITKYTNLQKTAHVVPKHKPISTKNTHHQHTNTIITLRKPSNPMKLTPRIKCQIYLILGMLQQPSTNNTSRGATNNHVAPLQVQSLHKHHSNRTSTKTLGKHPGSTTPATANQTNPGMQDTSSENKLMKLKTHKHFTQLAIATKPVADRTPGNKFPTTPTLKPVGAEQAQTNQTNRYPQATITTRAKQSLQGLNIVSRLGRNAAIFIAQLISKQTIPMQPTGNLTAQITTICKLSQQCWANHCTLTITGFHLSQIVNLAPELKQVRLQDNNTYQQQHQKLDLTPITHNNTNQKTAHKTNPTAIMAILQPNLRILTQTNMIHGAHQTCNQTTLTHLKISNQIPQSNACDTTNPPNTQSQATPTRTATCNHSQPQTPTTPTHPSANLTTKQIVLIHYNIVKLHKSHRKRNPRYSATNPLTIHAAKTNIKQHPTTNHLHSRNSLTLTSIKVTTNMSPLARIHSKTAFTANQIQVNSSYVKPSQPFQSKKQQNQHNHKSTNPKRSASLKPTKTRKNSCAHCKPPNRKPLNKSPIHTLLVNVPRTNLHTSYKQYTTNSQCPRQPNLTQLIGNYNTKPNSNQQQAVHHTNYKHNLTEYTTFDPNRSPQHKPHFKQTCPQIANHQTPNQKYTNSNINAITNNTITLRPSHTAKSAHPKLTTTQQCNKAPSCTQHGVNLIRLVTCTTKATYKQIKPSSNKTKLISITINLIYGNNYKAKLPDMRNLHASANYEKQSLYASCKRPNKIIKNPQYIK
eukprot:gene3059-2041_t